MQLKGLLNILYKDHDTNNDVNRKLQGATKEYAELFLPCLRNGN